MTPLALLSVLALAPLPPLPALPEAPRWELQMLGLTDDAALTAARGSASGRVVTIAVVGIGGVSKPAIRPHLYPGCSFYYRGGSGDPGGGTHDTGQVPVILDLTGALGLRVRLACYQPANETAALAEAFAAAGAHADIVVCYLSFWGEEALPLRDAIARRPDTLYLLPYGEVGEPRTSTSLQAHSCKPWGGGLENLFTCAPLARKSDGSLLQPSRREARDTEVIDFVAPSYYANGPGGTCPSVGVAAAVAAYAVAAAPSRPRREELARLLRASATVDAAALTCAPPFTAAHVGRLRGSLEKLARPDAGGHPCLAYPGVLSLARLREALR